jgi:hypothetical protein
VVGLEPSSTSQSSYIKNNPRFEKEEVGTRVCQTLESWTKTCNTLQNDVSTEQNSKQLKDL